MDREEELRQWFDIAARDLNIAKHLLTTLHPTPDEMICFLCQQSVEKDLKGFLFYNNVEFSKTHDLSVLIIMCSDILPEILKFTKQCNFISRYAVMPRYPNEIQINDDEVKSAVRFAEDIKAFVLSKVGM